MQTTQANPDLMIQNLLADLNKIERAPATPKPEKQQEPGFRSTPVLTAAKTFPADFGELSYNESNKKRFLNAARTLLKQVGQALQAAGWIDAVDISINKAGIACGGDAYGYFYAPGGQHGVLITITHGGFGHRRDGVSCYGQFRAATARRARKGKGEPRPYLGQILEGNVYPDHISPASVLALVQRMLDQHPAAPAA